MRSTFFWSIPVTFGGLILADRIILYVFGENYLGGVFAFKILIWNCIIYFFSATLSNLLYALKKQKEVMFVFFVGAILNTVLNIIFIPTYGINGAAFTTLLAELIVLFGMYLKTSKYTNIQMFSNLWQPVCAGSAMILFLITVHLESIIHTIILGALVYFGSIYSIQLLSKSLKKHHEENAGRLSPESLRNDQY